MAKYFKNSLGNQKITVFLRKDEKIFLQDFAKRSGEFVLEVFLEGENASVEILGRIQTFGEDSKKWTVKIFVTGENQTAKLDLRGTAENESFLEFNGSAVLQKESQNADAKISEKILLFDTAKGKCLPELRVETNQVKSASHSATITPIDTEKILYLESKGISKTETEKLLKKGFLLLESKK